MELNIKKKVTLAVLPCILALFFSGCWDYIEVERRGYILGAAIDKAEYRSSYFNELEYMPLEGQGPLYAFTIQTPIISRSQNKPTGQSGGNADRARDWNLTVISNAFFEANREYATRLNYPPYYSHLQAIVISEDAAEDNIEKLIDMFIRDPEMRRRTKVFITPGSAREVLEVIPKIDDFSSQYLRTLPNNSKRTSRIIHKTDLGKVSEAIHEHRDFILPKVVATKYEIKDAGCVVFKNNRMAGELDEIKTNYLKWITNYVNGGIVTINHPQYNNSTIVLETRKIKTKQRPIVKNNSLQMHLDIKANMNIGEVSLNETTNIMNPNFIAQLEKLAEEKITEQIKDTISYVQSEYGTDIFYFGVNLQRFAPSTWDKVKDNWDEVFKTLNVSVDVKVNIKQIGLTK